MSDDTTFDLTDVGADRLDAILTGQVADDDRELAFFVDSMRALYASDIEPERSPMLRRYTEAGSPRPTPVVRQRRRRLAAVAAFTGTVAGKLTLGGAVAVAAVGGLHATDTVHLPFVPHLGDGPSEPHEDEPASVVGDEPIAPPTAEPAVGQTAPGTAQPPAAADGPVVRTVPGGGSSADPGTSPVTETVPPVTVPVPSVTTPPTSLPLPEVSVPEVP